MNNRTLWKKRSGARFKELLRYGRYIFNDHLLIVMIFLLGGGAYYYNQWVGSLDHTFPAAMLFAFIFAFLLSGGNVITFLKEPDQVYLLPMETELKPYFIRSFLFTYFWRLYIQFMTLLVLTPVYLHTSGTQGGLLFFALLLAGMTAFNLFHRWNVDYDQDPSTVTADYWLRIIFNGMLVFFFMEGRWILTCITFIIFLFYGLYFFEKRRRSGLPWERLVANEERRMARFYRFANLFTDVPELRNRVKRRKWADLFVKKNYLSDETYAYLLSRTFLRSGDYFGLSVRLTVICSLVIWGVKNPFASSAAAFVFIYLTGIQLLPLWKHHDSVLWSQLYPLDDGLKRKSFLKLLYRILFVQAIVFSLILSVVNGPGQGFLLLLVLSLFCYVFVYIYGKNRCSVFNE